MRAKNHTQLCKINRFELRRVELLTGFYVPVLSSVAKGSHAVLIRRIDDLKNIIQ